MSEVEKIRNFRGQTNGFNFRRDADTFTLADVPPGCPVIGNEISDILECPRLRDAVTAIAKRAAARTVTRLFEGVEEVKERGRQDGRSKQ